MYFINRLFIAAILLSGWFVFVVINRGFFAKKISAMPQNNLNNLGNSPAPTIDRNLGVEYREDDLQSQIRSELYNSISPGMTYEEVSSIIGWKGVLIYDSEVGNRGETVRTKVYQWNYEDFDPNNSFSISSERKWGDLYKNLTLEFQDNILIDRTFTNSEP